MKLISLGKKIFEFCYILPYLNSKKRNYRVENLLDKSQLSDDDYKVLKKIFEADSIMIDEKKNIKNDYPPKERNKLNRKWGFASMLETIEKCNLNELANPTILSFPYGMMSNMSHMDFDSLQYIYERFSRTDEEFDKVNTKQICRQYIDIYYLFFLRILCLCILYDNKHDELINLVSIKHKTLLDLLDKKSNKL